MRIDPTLLDQVVDHARRDTSEECCGIVAARDGVATEVIELENLAHDRRRFEIDGMKLFGVLETLEARGETIGAIYHSHLLSAPEPSQTDMNFATGWPGVEWIIVGLKGGEPEVRSWLIDDFEYHEVELEPG